MSCWVSVISLLQLGESVHTAALGFVYLVYSVVKAAPKLCKRTCSKHPFLTPWGVVIFLRENLLQRWTMRIHLCRNLSSFSRDPKSVYLHAQWYVCMYIV